MNDSVSISGLPSLEPGWVWLAGAGPGDPGLLTVLALRGLQQADVVVHDALVDERVLTLIRPGATLEFAGKRGGRPSARQRDISRRLIELAQAGRRVLRLKGGDPFVFGRGGEEAMALARAGVSFRVVPGITAAVGGLAYAGLPLTHRDANSAVTLVTGHASSGDVPDGLDWEAIAKGSPVIVLYMAIKHLERIVGLLIAAGRPGDEAVAVISEATTSRQRILRATLASVAEAVRVQAMTPPALVAIGRIVELEGTLGWLGVREAGAGLERRRAG